MRFNPIRLRIVRVRGILVWLLLALLRPDPVSAQGSTPTLDPQDDTQLWTAIQVAFPLRERVDLILAGTFRQGRNFTHPVYEGGGASLRFRLSRYFALSPIYQFVATQYYAGVHTRENRLSINGLFTFPIKRIVLDDAYQFEERIRKPQNSNRYRNRVQVEWPFRLRDGDYRLFISNEVFYDWRYHAWNRNRFAVGGGKRLSPSLGLDLFFLKQNAKFIRPRDVNAIGVTLRIRLDRPIHHLP